MTNSVNTKSEIKSFFFWYNKKLKLRRKESFRCSIYLEGASVFTITVMALIHLKTVTGKVRCLTAARKLSEGKKAYFYSDTLPFDLDCGMLTDVSFFGYITTCHVECRSPLNPTG